MILKIKDIKDIGSDKERVVLTALEDGDIGMHFMLNTIQIGDGEVSSEVSKPYWFPDIEVKLGDLVVVYTKKGKRGLKLNPSGKTSYFFYRNFDEPIYGDSEIPLVIEADNWSTKDTNSY